MPGGSLGRTLSNGAGSPDASPVISSLSMGTRPRDAHGVLVSSHSDPDPPLNPTVDSESDESPRGGDMSQQTESEYQAFRTDVRVALWEGGGSELTQTA